MSERHAWETHDRITVNGLSDDENRAANRLLEHLAHCSRRNLVREQYYDGKRALSRMTSVVPPQYHSLGLVLGWNAKAVDLLARRCNLDGFSWPDGDLESLGFGEIWESNQLGAEVDQGIVSSLTHATAFVATTRGAGGGEPDELIQFISALDGTGTWNARARRLDDFLSVTARDDDGRPSAFTLYWPGLVVSCESDPDAGWIVTGRDEHQYGMLVDPLSYRPRLKRPFGTSRMTRATMGLQDAAVRALIRLEGHMDVYSFPEYWLLGADSTVFGDQSRFQVMLGRIKAIPDDDTADNPRASVQQFSAASPEPHLADLNALSKLFARETSLPDSSLAITDFSNPTAADAYDAAQYDLIAEAEGATDEWTPPIRRAMLRALAMRNGSPEVPEAWRTIGPQWRSPRFLSRAAEADAGMKQVSAVPWLAETDVGLELLGLSPTQVRRALNQKQRARYSSAVSSLTSALSPAQQAEFGELVEEGANGGDGG